MHQKWISISLSLFASSVSAFYPYGPSPARSTSVSGVHTKRVSPITRPSSDTTTDDAGTITLDIKKVPIKRENQFSVLLSNKPSASNAIAIDQDGSDYSYFSTLNFGSKAQAMYMLIDTGSANTWVMGSSCTSTACQSHNTFGPSDSTTLEETSQTWDIAYGTGTVSGVLGSDTVAFGQYSINFTFGLATNTSSDFNNYPMDGILGLGPSSSNQLDTPTLMKALDDQANLQTNVLGVHLNRASDGSKDGELTIGGVDKTKFSGDLNYLSTVESDSWEISVDDAYVAGKECGLSDKTAVIDTGTSYILMPPDDAEALHALIPGSSSDGSSFTLPCDTTTLVQVSLNGVKYTVSPKDYVGKSSGSSCGSNIIGHQAFGPNVWILGDVFLKNVYTVFDFDKNRIGFGTTDGTSSTSSSSSSATASSSASTDTSSAKATPTSKGSTKGSSTSSTEASSVQATGTSTASSTSSSDTSTSASESSSSASAKSGAATGPVPLAILMPIAFAVALM